MFSVKRAICSLFVFLLLALMLAPASPVRASSTIYVSTVGSDTSGDGSLANPFRTINHALTITASGDEVVLRGAPALVNNIYAESIRIQQPNITIRSQSGEWAVIQCPVNDENIGQCVRFDVDSDGSRLQRVEVIGGYYYGIKLDTKWDWGDPNDRSGASHILIEDVKVHDTGRDAIKITPGCDDVTIRHVEIFNTGIRDNSNAEGIDNVNGDRMIVQDSYLHDIATNGIYFKGGSTDTLIERNRIERTGGAGILVGFDTSPEYFDLTANPQYYESIRGVVRNNIIRNTQGAGIGLYAAKDAQIWNNTLIDTAQAYHSPIYFGITYQDWDPNAGRPSSVNPIIRNNLVYQSINLPTECVFIRYSNDLGGLSALAGMPDMDYNLYFHDGSNCQFTDRRPTSPLDHGTFSQWQSHISGESHSLTSAPQLTTDGHLLANSPAIDAGICAGAPTDDFDGDQRPQGAACDIGADEYYTGTIPSYTITATAGSGGTISPSGAVTVNYGEDKTFTITPNTNYHIKDVLVDGNSVGAVPSYTFEHVTADHTITASFETNPPVLNHFEFNTISNQAANVPFKITIAAKDQYGNTYTAFNSSVTLSVNKGSITPPTTTNFVNGVLSNFSVTIPTANTGVKITATSSNGKTGTSNAFDVNSPSNDLNMHITSPTEGATITTSTFQVSGTFDSAPPTNNFKLVVAVGAESHTYNFTATGTTWGPVTVNMSDFPSMVSGKSYSATLQASTQSLSIPPCQTGVRTITWNPSPAASYTLHIPSGWSLISVPFDTNASSLSCQYVLSWDGSQWQNATTLHPGVGYLVLNSGNTKDVTITGTAPSSPFTESATGSWQLIGNPFTSPCTLTSTSTIQIILYWDGSQWKTADVKNLQPGIGYLVLTSSPGTFTFTTKP